MFPPTIRLQLTIHSAVSGVTPTDDPLCSLRRYSNRLSHVLCSVWRCYNQLSSLLCLSTDQPTIRRSTLPCRYYNLLSALLLLQLQPTISCALLCLVMLQPTVCCTLAVDIPTDYPPLYSIHAALLYPRNRLSALLYLTVLQLTIQSTDYPFCCLWRYYNRALRSALPVDIPIDLLPLYSACRYSTPPFSR
jgi:hypothetical protein